MTGRIKRLVHGFLTPGPGRKPRVIGMSRQDQRIQEEINRRREERRQQREQLP